VVFYIVSYILCGDCIQISLVLLWYFVYTLHDLVDGLTNSLKDSFRSIQDSLDNMKEIFLMADIKDEYNQEIYAWYDFEADCDDWYMDSYHFWDENHFHILFDNSTPLKCPRECSPILLQLKAVSFTKV
jgi:hypothetical protein